MDKKPYSQVLYSYDENESFIDSEEIKTYVKVEKRHFKKGEFFMTSTNLPKLLLEKNYSGLTYRVLFALQVKLEFNNRIATFRQNELAQELKTSQANISRSLKILEKDKIITKKNHDYYFSEEFIKGAGDNKSN